jgi:hypothetical protein
MRRIALLTGCLIVVGLPAFAEQKLPTAALLDLDRTPIGALLEQRLLASPRAKWLERNEVNRILKEQELSTLITADAVSRRVAMGQLLKADLLVILKQHSKPKKHVQLTVCETKRGLRPLVDPLSRRIEVASDEIQFGSMLVMSTAHVIARPEGFYNLLPLEKEVQLQRHGIPDLQRQIVMEDIPWGYPRFIDGRFHIIGKHWYALKLPSDETEGTVITLASKMPWVAQFLLSGPDTKRDPATCLPHNTIPRLSHVVKSNHYGVLTSAYDPKARESKYWQVVLTDLGDE